MKNFCQQWAIGYIDNSNKVENHLRTIKLYLNNKGNTKFARDLLSFIENSNGSLDFIGESNFSKGPRKVMEFKQLWGR